MKNCRGMRRDDTPEFGLDDNKYKAADESLRPLDPPPPPAVMISTEPELSCNPPVSPPLLLATDAPMAKTGRAGEINCPVMICGICV